MGKARRPKVKVFRCQLKLGNRRRRGINSTSESKAEWREEIDVSVLARAIERKQWQVAALCLVLGLLETVSRLPVDAVIGLFDVLDGGEDDTSEE
jgi:hypothetical protein